jgi:hypothetical protein
MLKLCRVYTCGLHINERKIKLGEFHHLLVINQADIKLLDIGISDKIIITDITKKPVEFAEAKSKAHDITYFDIHYGLLYKIKPDTGEVSIHHYKHRRDPLSIDDKITYSHYVECLYRGQVKIFGTARGIAGTVEGYDKNVTRVRIIVSDDEGIKFCKLEIKQLFSSVQDETMFNIMQRKELVAPVSAVPEAKPEPTPAPIMPPLPFDPAFIQKSQPINTLFSVQPESPVVNEQAKEESSSEDYEDSEEKEEKEDKEAKVVNEEAEVVERATRVKPDMKMEAMNDPLKVTSSELAKQSPKKTTQEHEHLKANVKPFVPKSISSLKKPAEAKPEGVIASDKPKVKKEKKGINYEALQNTIRDEVTQDIRNQFSSTIMPMVEESFKVLLRYKQ